MREWSGRRAFFNFVCISETDYWGKRKRKECDWRQDGGNVNHI